MPRRPPPSRSTPSRPGDGGPGSPPVLVFRLSPRFIPRSPAALYAWGEDDLAQLAEVVGAPGLLETLDAIGPHPVRPNMRMQGARLLRLEEEAGMLGGSRPRSLTQYWRVNLRNAPREVGRVLALLRSDPNVEAAWRMPLFANPMLNPANDPRYKLQVHLQDAPRGVGATYAWNNNATGKGVSFIDLERGWHKTGHKDLPTALMDSGVIRVLWGSNLADRTVRSCSPKKVATEVEDGSHGIQALGIVLGVDNNIGGIGLAPNATPVGVVSHQLAADADDDEFGFTRSHLPDAIVEACTHLDKGDVLLLEVEALVSDGADCWAWPVEIFDDVRDAIKLAVKAGVAVIEPAGNSGIDLDEEDVSVNFDSPLYEDSGAILVTASTWIGDHHRDGGFNRGARVDCFAEGDGLWTTGGDASVAGIWSSYQQFASTSGASAVIAGVALLAQSAAIISRGRPFSPATLRRLLGDRSLGTGARTGLGGASSKLGVMPDLSRIVPAIPGYGAG